MISVIIPVYNVLPYLGECVASIVAQTYKAWECILVDDGSTDGSGDICDEWAKKDGRIRVVHQENGGVSNARNKGVEEARGESIVFVDSDDTIGAEHLWRLANAADADLVVSGIRQICQDEQTDEMKPKTNKNFVLNKDSLTDFVDLNDKFLLYGPVAKLYKTSTLKKHAIRFPVGCNYGEDLQFNLQYLEYVKTITQVDDVSYFYRRGTETLSTKARPNQFFQDYEQWQMLRAFYEKRDLWSQLSKELLYKRLWGIIYDGIFSTATSNKQILSIQEIDDLKDFQHVFHCSKWIKWCILYRIPFAFR
ncbi:MAG: glycosyltransferase [Bacteroidaceae bacterium]|nr:glycosyltransferase [Bacteroidaceae bacterium]